MTEWTVVTVVIALLGLVCAVVTPVVKLNTSITRLNVTMDRIEKSQAEYAVRNTDSHRRLWEKNGEQDKILNDHEKRIHAVEGTTRSYKGEEGYRDETAWHHTQDYK